MKYLIFSKSYEIEIKEQIVLSFVRQGEKSLWRNWVLLLREDN